MMIRRHSFAMCVALTLFHASVLGAQRAGVVLALPASARAAGAADASLLATGASALFYGGQHMPAEAAVSASAGTWIGDAQFATVAVSLPIRRAMSIGFGVQSLDYGSADEIVPDPASGGLRGTATGARVSASELALTAGLALRARGIRAGVSLARLQQTVADLSASTLAMSGGVGVTRGGWDLDLVQQHGGQGIHLGATQSTLVSTTRGALRTPSWSIGAWQWLGVAEWRNVRGEGSTSLVGAEGTVGTAVGWQLTVRGAGSASSAATAREPWSVGGSAARGAWSLDYAYQGFGALGAVHRMGVSWRSRGARSPSR
jgi:hypothetical protein